MGADTAATNAMLLEIAKQNAELRGMLSSWRMMSSEKQEKLRCQQLEAANGAEISPDYLAQMCKQFLHIKDKSQNYSSCNPAVELLEELEQKDGADSTSGNIAGSKASCPASYTKQDMSNDVSSYELNGQLSKEEVEYNQLMTAICTDTAAYAAGKEIVPDPTKITARLRLLIASLDKKLQKLENQSVSEDEKTLIAKSTNKIRENKQILQEWLYNINIKQIDASTIIHIEAALKQIKAYDETIDKIDKKIAGCKHISAPSVNQLNSAYVQQQAPDSLRLQSSLEKKQDASKSTQQAPEPYAKRAPPEQRQSEMLSPKQSLSKMLEQSKQLRGLISSYNHLLHEIKYAQTTAPSLDVKLCAIIKQLNAEFENLTTDYNYICNRKPESEALDDIEIYNPDEIEKALATRSDYISRQTKEYERLLSESQKVFLKNGPNIDDRNLQANESSSSSRANSSISQLRPNDKYKSFNK